MELQFVLVLLCAILVGLALLVLSLLAMIPLAAAFGPCSLCGLVAFYLGLYELVCERMECAWLRPLRAEDADNKID